mgnify:CR=1 FL=1
MDQIINHAVLSLDFWQDTVTYESIPYETEYVYTSPQEPLAGRC